MSLLSQSGPTTSYGSGSPAPRRDGDDAVKRAVERGPHQLRHAGVEDREPRAARIFLHVHDAREEQAGGAHESASGLEHDGAARSSRHPSRMAARVIRRCRDAPRRRTRCRARRRDPRGRARCRRRAGRSTSATIRRAARASGSSDVICEPTWMCTPDRVAARPSRRPRDRGPALTRSARRTCWCASPVEMCGWLRASMSGFTRSATRARGPVRPGERGDALQLAR